MSDKENIKHEPNVSTSQQRIFIAEECDAGLRLDKFLANKMPEFSRSEIQKYEIRNTKHEPMIGASQSRNTKLSDKVKIGDEFIVDIPDVANTGSCLASCNSYHDKFPLDILFEDDDIIVVNKPRGVAMYPGAGRESGTLVGQVLAHCPLSSIGDENRPGVVHRLDKDTSGAVVFAKTDAAHRVLTKMFSEHNLTRKYICFIWGVPNWEGADIIGNIGRSAKNRQKMTMLKIGGRIAKTHADVMNAWARENISQLKCTLFTGRTHQIRVHLSGHGFPILCDPVYGKDGGHLGSVKNPELMEFLKGRRGQMLHAEILDFVHPITGADLHFKAHLPDDMRELRDILNGD